MIPDADIIIACPYCDARARVFQLLSSDTRGAITWTDGWMDAPMMPRTPRISRCEKCSKIFWVATATQLGFIPLGDTGEAAGEHKDAPHVGPLDEAGCYEALREGLAPTEDLELELRVFAWWRGNDAFREPDHAAGHATSADAVANMERIFELTKETWDEDLLLFRAEALRHLGRFEEALKALEGVGCSDYWPAKSRQLELLEAQNRNVAILFSPENPPQIPEA
ncbi:MAG: hypothetical protein ABMA13_07120 [Chthoniobacteraceae bacterium]